MKNVIILLSIFLFLFVAGVGNAGNGKIEDADYILFYDKNGKVKGAKLTDAGVKKKCKLTQGKDVDLKDIYQKHTKAEALAVDVIKFSGSPDCIIYIGGWPVCVCCP